MNQLSNAHGPHCEATQYEVGFWVIDSANLEPVMRSKDQRAGQCMRPNSMVICQMHGFEINYFISLSLILFICKTGTVISNLQGYWENQRHCMWSSRHIIGTQQIAPFVYICMYEYLFVYLFTKHPRYPFTAGIYSTINVGSKNIWGLNWNYMQSVVPMCIFLKMRVHNFHNILKGVWDKKKHSRHYFLIWPHLCVDSTTWSAIKKKHVCNLWFFFLAICMLYLVVLSRDILHVYGHVGFRWLCLFVCLGNANFIMSHEFTEKRQRTVLKPKKLMTNVHVGWSLRCCRKSTKAGSRGDTDKKSAGAKPGAHWGPFCWGLGSYRTLLWRVAARSVWMS